MTGPTRRGSLEWSAESALLSSQHRHGELSEGNTLQLLAFLTFSRVCEPMVATLLDLQLALDPLSHATPIDLHS